MSSSVKLKEHTVAHKSVSANCPLVFTTLQLTEHAHNEEHVEYMLGLKNTNVLILMCVLYLAQLFHSVCNA